MWVCIFCCNDLHLLCFLSFFYFLALMFHLISFLMWLLSTYPPFLFALFTSLLFSPFSPVFSFLVLHSFTLPSPLPSSFPVSSTPLLCPLLSPVRYQRQPCSAWLPLKNRPWQSPALCHTGTSSKPVSRGRWSYLCHSDTCSSACSQGPMAQLQHGASLLPSDQTSPGRVCLCLWSQNLGVA